MRSEPFERSGAAYDALLSYILLMLVQSEKKSLLKSCIGSGKNDFIISSAKWRVYIILHIISGMKRPYKIVKAVIHQRSRMFEVTWRQKKENQVQESGTCCVGPYNTSIYSLWFTSWHL